MLKIGISYKSTGFISLTGGALCPWPCSPSWSISNFPANVSCPSALTRAAVWAPVSGIWRRSAKEPRWKAVCPSTVLRPQIPAARWKHGSESLCKDVFDGSRHTWRLQLICRLAKQGGKQRITEKRASTYYGKTIRWYL